MNSKTKNLAIMFSILIAAGAAGWLMAPSDLSADTSVPKAHGVDDALKGTTPGQWRVIWHENPATEATIAWSTKQNDKSTLYLDTKSREGNVKKYKMTSKVVSGQFTTDEEDVFYHRAELTKLKPATKYWFTMQTGKSVSQEFWFETAPNKDA
ncbi:MAG: fibronectin type III domain-containing protein, partial [Planctomycetota bacterium]